VSEPTITLYRCGKDWLRAEAIVVPLPEGTVGCSGCYFQNERAADLRCQHRPCIPSMRDDGRDVTFKLIPEALSRRFKVFKTDPKTLWLRHRLSRNVIKPLHTIRIVDIQ